MLDIDEKLNHPKYNLADCVTLVRQAGYDGYLGIEYEGSDDPISGITRGQTLLNSLL